MVKNHINIDNFINEVDKLFYNLEKNNILAEKEFTCCETCGHNEMKDIISDDKIGYVFYPIIELYNMKKDKNKKLKISCGVRNDELTEVLILSIEEECKKLKIDFNWDNIKNDDMQIILSTRSIHSFK